MHFRKILSGTLAVLLLSSAAAHAEGSILGNPLRALGEAISGESRNSGGLPGVFGARDEKPVQYAQAGDPRITALEEQVRSLSGTIEELNFQILQMQEQMRKMQEDVDFRLQEIEQKGTNAGGNRTSVEPPPALSDQAAAPELVPEQAGTDPVGEVIIEQQAEGGNGAPPTNFGTIVVDKDGNVVSATTDQQTTEATPALGEVAQQALDPVAPAQPAQAAQPEAPADDTVVAALPSTGNPEELYRSSYEFILSGDYKTAEAGFRDHIDRFPNDPMAADAHFWLGEAVLSQQNYAGAAEIFLEGSKAYPDSKKAPDMLLKLGVSLVGLKQREVACATFAEVAKRYPDSSDALKERVKAEQALAAC
jgi:tol-pal system protein YbgF